VTSSTAKNIGDQPSNRFHVQEFIPDELATALLAAGFIVPDGELYGQRQRRFHRSWTLRKLSRLIFGNPNKKKSAVVEPVTNLTPRYFLLIARKAGEPERRVSSE